MATLVVKNLFKHYKNAKYISAADISFDVKEGEIFGFLGINGAGKSTTIKCITGIIPFTSGTIQVCGHDMGKDAMNAKMNFGFVPDNHAVYDKLTGVEYINYLADLYKVPANVRQENFERLSKIFNMENAVNNQIMSYSHGMKQKISIMGALIHSPKLWILDEPMVGLDPQSIYEVKNYMREYAKAGNSVFFSSHNLDTVELLCDRAIAIHGGKVLKEFDLNQYRKTGKSLEAEFLAMTQEATRVQNEARKALRDKEDDLAKTHGRNTANKMIIAQIRQELENAIAQSQAGEQQLNPNQKDNGTPQPVFSNGDEVLQDNAAGFDVSTEKPSRKKGRGKS